MASRQVFATPEPRSGPRLAGEAVLDALGSERCRAILADLQTDRLTADELADRLAIPISTVYRHLRTLTEHGLVRESIRIELGGRNRREYGSAASAITVSFDDGVGVHLVDAVDDR